METVIGMMLLTLAAIAIVNAKTYHLGTSTMNWFTAQVYCNNMDMHLATIESEIEHNNIVKLITEKGNPKSSFWTSGNDFAETGKYVWSSNLQPFVYTKWGKTEPNSEVEHCVDLYGAINLDWNDVDCKAHKFYPVCESSDDISHLTNGLFTSPSRLRHYLNKMAYRVRGFIVEYSDQDDRQEFVVDKDQV